MYETKDDRNGEIKCYNQQKRILVCLFFSLGGGEVGMGAQLPDDVRAVQSLVKKYQCVVETNQILAF